MQKLSIEEYFAELKKHDWFYEFSEDHTKWTKGKDNETRLKNLGCYELVYKEMYEDFVKFYDFKVENLKHRVPEPKLEDYL
jgi:hypothetical protein